MKNLKNEMNDYLACAIIEGFCEGENATIEDQVNAWAYLIKTGTCWNLQGFYGRNAKYFIENNIINREGQINWDLIEL